MQAEGNENTTPWYSYLSEGEAMPIPGITGYSALDDGTILNPKGRPLSAWQRVPGGAWRVQIKQNVRMVSWLTLISRTGVPPMGYVVSYRDGDPSNGHISNLEWGPE